MDQNKENEQEEKKDEEVLEPEEIQEDSEVAHLQDKVVELEDKYRRALADYQNLQRRTAEQRIEWARTASQDIVLKLLPVLDTLMLAYKHIQDKGLELSINQFLQILSQEGIEKIKTVGEKFDPYTMEAVGTTEGKEGEVVEEVRIGFILNDSVLRSAQVIVGKNV